jgi:hypothetical protein
VCARVCVCVWVYVGVGMGGCLNVYGRWLVHACVRACLCLCMCMSVSALWGAVVWGLGFWGWDLGFSLQRTRDRAHESGGIEAMMILVATPLVVCGPVHLRVGQHVANRQIVKSEYTVTL